MASAPFDPLTTTATELQEFLNSRQLTSVQLVDMYLSEIEKYNEWLKAVICTAPRSDLIKKAHELDRERADGANRSHLHGLPILIKVHSRSLGSLISC